MKKYANIIEIYSSVSEYFVYKYKDRNKTQNIFKNF